MVKILDRNGKELMVLALGSLYGAKLRGAKLRGADLRGANLITLAWSHWATYMTPGHIRIGCQSHPIEEWRNFSDQQIADMEPRALDFWKENKELIVGLCERFDVNESKETVKHER